MSIAEIQSMTSKERLQAMEALWDAMCHEIEEPKSPDWHKKILDSRRKRIESGEAKFYSIEDARRHLLG